MTGATGANSMEYSKNRNYNGFFFFSHSRVTCRQMAILEITFLETEVARNVTSPLPKTDVNQTATKPRGFKEQSLQNLELCRLFCSAQRLPVSYNGCRGAKTEKYRRPKVQNLGLCTRRQRNFLTYTVRHQKTL